MVDKPRINLGHVPALDGLRAVAVISVMGYHLGVPGMDGGLVGVDMFFVLSGFLITNLLVKEYQKTDGINLRNFYIRRLLRLYPALLLMLITWDVISTLFIGNGLHVIGASLITLVYMTNWARAFGLYDMVILAHTWSLSIEEQFYIFWPLLLVLMLRLRPRLNTLALLIIVLAGVFWALRAFMTIAGVSEDLIYNGLITRADALLFGSALGILFANNGLGLRQSKLVNQMVSIVNQYGRYATLAATIFFAWVLVVLDRHEYRYYYWVSGCISLATCLLIFDVCRLQRSALRPILELKPLVWLGRISYGLYLWHYPIYSTMQNFHIQGVIIAVVGSVITLVATLLSYYLLERPILKLKSRFKTTETIKDPALLAQV